MTQVTGARAVIDRVMTERQLLQVFGPGLTPPDLAGIIANLSTRQLKAGEALITEGEAGTDLFVIRSGSCTVDKTIGGKSEFLFYVTVGSFVGEMAVVNGGVRSATVRATVKTEVVQIDGPAFHALLANKPDVMARLKAAMASRQKINDFVAAQKESFGSIVDLHTETARFMVANGLGEATDVLLIDETLCIGCDNCEKACADTHDGLSRLDRESGKTFAHLHVPTSCRHCEHPHCMSECPPNAISRGPDGEVRIDDSCIGCGNCVRFCPYGVIRLDKAPPKKPPLLSWLLFGAGPGPGEPSHDWADKNRKGGAARRSARSNATCARGSRAARVASGRARQGRPSAFRPSSSGGSPTATSPRADGDGEFRQDRLAARPARSRHDRQRPAPRRLSAPPQFPLGEDRADHLRHRDPCLCPCRPDAAPERRDVARLCPRHGRCRADPVADAIEASQARDYAGAVVVEGVDQRPRLSRPQPRRHRHPPYRLPVRLERPHACLRADDDRHRVGPVRHRRV